MGNCCRCLTCAVVTGPALCTVTAADGQIQYPIIHANQWTYCVQEKRNKQVCDLKISSTVLYIYKALNDLSQVFRTDCMATHLTSREGHFRIGKKIILSSLKVLLLLNTKSHKCSF